MTDYRNFKKRTEQGNAEKIIGIINDMYTCDRAIFSHAVINKMRKKAEHVTNHKNKGGRQSVSTTVPKDIKYTSQNSNPSWIINLYLRLS